MLGQGEEYSLTKISLPVWAISVIKIRPSAQQWIDQ